MTIKVSSLKRVFKYNGMKLQDPSPEMTPDEVRTFYAASFPELLTAVVEGPTTDHRAQTFDFRRAVGTKGNSR